MNIKSKRYHSSGFKIQGGSIKSLSAMPSPACVWFSGLFLLRIIESSFSSSGIYHAKIQASILNPFIIVWETLIPFRKPMSHLYDDPAQDVVMTDSSCDMTHEGKLTIGRPTYRMDQISQCHLNLLMVKSESDFDTSVIIAAVKLAPQY